MPVINAPVTNEQLRSAMNLADAKGMPLKEWASAVIIAEIHRLSNTPSFTNTEGVPRVPQYERPD